MLDLKDNLFLFLPFFSADPMFYPLAVKVDTLRKVGGANSSKVIHYFIRFICQPIVLTFRGQNEHFQESRRSQKK